MRKMQSDVENEKDDIKMEARVKRNRVFETSMDELSTKWVNRKRVAKASRVWFGILLLFSCQVISDSFATPWTVPHQAPLSTGFTRWEYWSGLPVSFPGHLPDPGIEPASPALQANSLQLNHQGSPSYLKIWNGFEYINWFQLSLNENNLFPHFN